jgi:hypothetical protein
MSPGYNEADSIYMSKTTLASTSSVGQDQLPYNYNQATTTTTDAIFLELLHTSTQLETVARATTTMVNQLNRLIPNAVTRFEHTSKTRFKQEFRVWAVALPYVQAIAISSSFLGKAAGWADPQVPDVVHKMCPIAFEAIYAIKIAHAIHAKKYGSPSLEPG